MRAGVLGVLGNLRASQETSGAMVEPVEIGVRLKRVKSQLKEFEHEFFKEHGQRPSKSDLAENKDITALYREYSKLKASRRSFPTDACALYSAKKTRSVTYG